MPYAILFSDQHKPKEVVQTLPTDPAFVEPPLPITAPPMPHPLPVITLPPPQTLSRSTSASTGSSDKTPRLDLDFKQELEEGSEQYRWEDPDTRNWKSRVQRTYSRHAPYYVRPSRRDLPRGRRFTEDDFERFMGLKKACFE